MGIRVSCPNGHVLNVKSHLAGKKGKCPTCGAAFEIPSSAAEAEQDADSPRTTFDQIDIEQLTRESAQTVSRPANHPQSASRPRASGGAAAGFGEGSVSVAVIDEPAKPSGNSGGGPPTEITSDPTSVWYVRRASGEQYGPAQGLMFWQWVQEGRVPEDSHVWKQGWPEWKSAREWLARKEPSPQRAAQSGFAAASQSAARPNVSPAPTTPAARSTILNLPDRASQPMPAAISPVGATATRVARRRKNADVTAAIIILLLLIFLASLTGAIVVVYQSMK
jgi:hypothetical protein